MIGIVLVRIQHVGRFPPFLFFLFSFWLFYSLTIRRKQAMCQASRYAITDLPLPEEATAQKAW